MLISGIRGACITCNKLLPPLSTCSPFQVKPHSVQCTVYMSVTNSHTLSYPSVSNCPLSFTPLMETFGHSTSGFLWGLKKDFGAEYSRDLLSCFCLVPLLLSARQDRCFPSPCTHPLLLCCCWLLLSHILILNAARGSLYGLVNGIFIG